MGSSFQRTVSIFLAFFLCFIQISPIYCEEKVSLTLYYESLCPYCSNFIVNYLPKIFKNGLIDVVDLKLVPWGNTKLQANNTFKCQHGPAECFLDTLEACAIDAWPDLNEHFPFIYCVESLVYHKNYTQWETCFEKLNLKAKLVKDCVGSGRGKELELRYAAETNALQPPHKYVPWVVVDGQPLYDDYRDFISYICKAYKGTTPIPGCSSSVNVIKMGKKISPFCLKQAAISKLSTISSTFTSSVNRVKLAASA
ncbi:gamma-interferon-responsive lysosomal thiol protein-like isoform X2 [Nicotiana tomentosiformis]|uniref:gamma-interferon-responsive lysosomal thiol protein-like isoform X2 n=1 Tax=Nicotiana tomentosiformis TaxID=4098 RepID=UPI00051B1E2F|nr:gamma-interferon-responsive lysosomal thiol protein-like isoform X2 [Nicotiana tomentosiformis]